MNLPSGSAAGAASLALQTEGWRVRRLRRRRFLRRRFGRQRMRWIRRRRLGREEGPLDAFVRTFEGPIALAEEVASGKLDETLQRRVDAGLEDLEEIDDPIADLD